MGKDYYKILGVDKNASADDIKKAYRKAAIKYHPDKQAGKSDEEKKKAEENFKDINEANDVLSDPQKRKNYDMFGDPEGRPGFGGMGGNSHSWSWSSNDGGPIPEEIEDLINQFTGGSFGGRKQYQRKRQPENGASIKTQIPITVEDLFNGGTKKFEYDIEKKCPECNGVGGKGTKKCPQCDGKGMYKSIRETFFGTQNIMGYCGKCNGTGQVPENTCPTCGGTGVVTEHKSIEIEIPHNVQNGQTIIRPGEGYEAKEKGGHPGDLIIEFVYAIDQSKYRYVNGTIYNQISVPYYDCIVGAERKITLPDKKEYTYKVPANSVEGTQIKIAGTPVPFVLVIKPQISTNVSEKEVELLKEIQKLH